MQRPSVCNAMETLLVHKDIADKFLPMMLMMYNSSAVEICGDEAVQEYSGQVHPVTEEDWSTEYGDLRLSVKIVDSIEEAMAHIAKYGTGHSECIVTNNYQAAQLFQYTVDAAAVYVNASTVLPTATNSASVRKSASAHKSCMPADLWRCRSLRVRSI